MLDHLNSDVLNNIFIQLPFGDLLNCISTCKSLYCLSKDKQFWEILSVDYIDYYYDNNNDNNNDNKLIIEPIRKKWCKIKSKDELSHRDYYCQLLTFSEKVARRFLGGPGSENFISNLKYLLNKSSEINDYNLIIYFAKQYNNDTIQDGIEKALDGAIKKGHLKLVQRLICDLQKYDDKYRIKQSLISSALKTASTYNKVKIYDYIFLLYITDL
jgi:hypothetical protein